MKMNIWTKLELIDAILTAIEQGQEYNIETQLEQDAFNLYNKSKSVDEVNTFLNSELFK